jgi:hypothetical protein
MKQLSDSELKKLSEVMDSLESETLKSTSISKISGGFATTNIIDYDDNIIDIELQFGTQSDVESSVYSEQYKVSRLTFKIIH